MRGERFNRFTLVELLVVISIIAVLMAMLLPALRRARREAERVVCANNQKQVSVSMTNYADDFGSYVPYSSFVHLNGAQNNNHPAGRENWAHFMYKRGYVANKKNYYCPAVSEAAPSYSEDFLDDTDDPWKFAYISFGYNTAGIGDDWFNGEVARDPAQPARLNKINRPSETILTCDAISWSVHVAWLGVVEAERPFYIVDWGHGLIQSRHSGYATISWIDGHVDANLDAESLQVFPSGLLNKDVWARYAGRL